MFNKDSKIIAVTVSVDYDDFLRRIIDKNKKFFKDWYVVTDKEDVVTQYICDSNGLKCVIEDDWYNEEYESLNKGKYMNAGLRKAFKNRDEDDWILIVDSDILLNEYVMNRFITRINLGRLDKNDIYWVPRVFIDEKETYDKLENSNFDINVSNELLESGETYRFIYEQEGAGYFQLFYKEMYYDETKLQDWLIPERKLMHDYIIKGSDAVPEDFKFPEYELIDIDFIKKFRKLRIYPGHIYHVGKGYINWSTRVAERWD